MNYKRILVAIIIIASLFTKNISAQDSAFVNFITNVYLYVELEGVLVVKIKDIESNKTIEYAMPNWVFYEIFKQNTLNPSNDKYLTMLNSLLLNHTEYAVTSIHEKDLMKKLKRYEISNSCYNKLKDVDIESIKSKYFDKNGNIIKKRNKKKLNAVIKILFEHNIFVYIGCIDGGYSINNFSNKNFNE